MRSFRKRFAIGLVWALIPLTLLGSLPRMGCICADGKHKLLCERQFHRKSGCKGDSGTCSCCHGNSTKSDHQSNDQVAKRLPPSDVKSCCAERRANQRLPLGKHFASSDRCCTPQITVPVLLPALDSGIAI